MRLRSAIHAYLIITVFILLSCSSDRKGRHSFQVEEIDDVLTAVNQGAPKHDGELFEYQEELRLVADPEHPDSYLVNPDPPIVDAAGNFYVNDSRTNQIVAFDMEGRFLHTIGREGEGPGDLDFPRNLQIVSDTLYVNSHIASWRLTRFTTDGSLVDLTVQRVPTNLAIPTLYQGPAGWLMIQVNNFPVVGDDWFVGSRMVVLSSNKDTVAVVETPSVPFGKSYARDDQGTPYAPTMMQYVGYPTLGFKPEQGIFASSGMEPVVQFYDLTGELTKVIRIDMVPEEITSVEKKAFLDSIRNELYEARNRSNPSALTITRLEATISDPPFPQHKGYWRGVDIDDAGWIWLSMVEPPLEVQTELWAPLYKVLSPEGEYLGDTVWPLLVAGHIRGGRLLGIREDPETGEKIPIIYRMISLREGMIYP